MTRSTTYYLYFTFEDNDAEKSMKNLIFDWYICNFYGYIWSYPTSYKFKKISQPIVIEKSPVLLFLLRALQSHGFELHYTVLKTSIFDVLTLPGTKTYPYYQCTGLNFEGTS